MPDTSMTSAEIALVKADFAAVAPRAEAFAGRFYEILFAQAPWTRHLFRSTEPRAQAGKLAGALALLVANLERPAAIAGPLRALGAKHAGYGVTDAHYADVAGALLAALAEAVGEENWTEAQRQAWTGAYMIAAGAMQEGAASQPMAA